jgi:tetratricopeptide (TPR) repeat protein
MAKPGRNEPCPCGSGKKYKRCCLDKDQEAERRLQRKTAAETAARLAAQYDIDETEQELASASNAAVDLVHEGKLDEAEEAARELLERFPSAHDGWDRLGMVYQARGDNQKAADCYRKVIDLIRANPDDYDPGFEAVFHKLVARLDPTPTAG